MGQPRAALSGEAVEIQERARRGEELFWGGAVCWWGGMRRQLTPDLRPFEQAIDCPVDGLLPDSHRALDSHAVVREYLGSLDGRLDEPAIISGVRDTGGMISLAVYECTKPVIGDINGAAVGIGAGRFQALPAIAAQGSRWSSTAPSNSGRSPQDATTSRSSWALIRRTSPSRSRALSSAMTTRSTTPH